MNSGEKNRQISVLIVEDDVDICILLDEHLSAAGYLVERAADGPSGVEAAVEQSYDLVILDIMLPGFDGFEVCRRIRERDSELPILMLTARSDVADRVLGLETGADDYLTKPFRIEELMARVRALLRRATSKDIGPQTAIQIGSLAIDPEKRSVTLAATPVKLTLKEFELLYFLASSPGKPFSRADLLRSVWGYDHEGYEHTVNSHINRLRSKLEVDPQQPVFVQTVWGVGYRFAEPDEISQ